MKKSLFKIFPFLMATLLVSLGLQTVIGGVAENETGNILSVEQSGEEFTSRQQQGVLRVKRCDFAAVVGEKEFYLPEYTAVSADGTDLSPLVEITDTLQCEINKELGTIILKEDGVHTITYSVYDRATESTLSRSFTVTRYRELFDYYNLVGSKNEYDNNHRQTCISQNTGQGISRFNIEASTLYYAEVYFRETPATDFKAGLAHILALDCDEGNPVNHWVSGMIDFADGMKHKVFTDRNWGLNVMSGTEQETSLSAGTGFKYAIARNGNTLYSFINDGLVGFYTYDALNDIPTKPGIFTAASAEGNFVEAGGVKISAIDYYDGEKALTMIRRLAGSSENDDNAGGGTEIDVGSSDWGDFDAPVNKQ